MSTENVGKRFESILRTIMDSRGLSQKVLGEKYLDVSQSCVRDYLSGKVHPLAVKVGTMQCIAALYGVSVDALMHYLMEGSWKQGLSYRDIDEAVRSITDLKLLCSLISLASDQARSRLEDLPCEEKATTPVINPNGMLISALEKEEQRVGSPSRWHSLLSAFDVNEGEIISLYNGQKPSLELMLRLAKLLRVEVDEIQDMVGIKPSSDFQEVIDSPIDLDAIEELTRIELNGEGISNAS